VLLFRASREGVALLESDDLPGSPKRDSTATGGAPPWCDRGKSPKSSCSAVCALQRAW